MSQERNMVIHFVDGTKIAYDFPKQIEDGAQMASKMEALLEKKFLIVEGDSTVHFYPVANIKSIQLYPVPGKLPDYAIRNAEAI